MKFSLKQTANGGVRLGTISGLHRLPELVLETPLLLLNTRGGTVPHITREVLEYLTKEKQAFQIPLPTTVQSYSTLQLYQKGISNFIGFPDHLVYCTVQDPGSPTPQGYSFKTSISVWAHKGRVPLSVDSYMDMMEAFKPDIYQAFCDGDTNPESTRKRCVKSVNHTENFLDVCIEKHTNSETLKSAVLFGVIEGGYNLKERLRSAKLVAKRPQVEGFVIDGLHNNGPGVTRIDFEKVGAIVEQTLKVLPEEKLRIVHGSWRPEHILKLMELGIDVFDSSLPYILTEEFSALYFKYEAVPFDFVAESNKTEQKAYSISMKNEKFIEDFKPISENCSCLTCRKHTKAYVYHLIKAKELLASTLLMLHNLHQYIEFFKFIRTANAEGKKVRII